MIIMRMADGLGNQLFIYAFGRYLSIKHNTELKLDTSAYQLKEWRRFELDRFNIKADIASESEINKFIPTRKNVLVKLARKLFYNILPVYIWNYVEENTSKFDYRLLKIRNNTYIRGYFQSEIFFKEIDAQLRSELTFAQSIPSKNKQILADIDENNSIMIHIRRGDFVIGSYAGHYALSVDYYLAAMAMMKAEIKSPHYFVFSDNMEWVKENITFSDPVIYVDHNAGDAVEDLRLMARCKHFIIANSTFSWWGAWLSPSTTKMIIAPKIWLKTELIDLSNTIPSSWIRI